MRLKQNIAFFNRMVGLANFGVRTCEVLFVIVSVSITLTSLFSLCIYTEAYNSWYNILHNNQMNAHALIGQSTMVYCASKLIEILRVF